MARRSLLASLLLLTMTTRTQSQFFDYFPSFQGFQNFQPPTLRPIQRDQPFEIHYIDGNTRNNRNKKTTTTTEKYDSVYNAAINKDIPFSSFLDVPERDNTRQFFINNKKDNNFNSYTSTSKPRNNSSQRNTTKNNNSRNKNNNHNSNFNNNKYDVNNNENENQSNTNYDHKPIVYDNNKNNNIFDNNYYTTGPQYNEMTTKHQYNYNQQTTPRPYTENSYNQNQYTTKLPTNHREPNNDRTRTTKPTRTEHTTSDPFYNRPAVKPVYNYGPPITNKPIRPTERPSSDGLVFPEDEEETKLVTGPDEDQMSEVEKRRYNELIERTCDRWKALSQKQVQAIPLLPSPDAVRVNVSCAAPATPLIVGGRAVSAAQYPHSAAVGWKAEGGSYSWKCGGSLISDQFVLTAAHCTFVDRDNSVASGPPEVVQLGSSHLNGRDAKIYKISVAIRHPKYKRPVAYHDIALLKLANKVAFTDTIRPACIGSPPPPGTQLTATGWGRTEFNGAQSNELRGVSLPVWDMAACARALGASRRLPRGPAADSQLCAGELAGGKDTCQGDSGGPLQYRDGCAWRVAGATSLGVACGAPRTPALYALPARYFVAATAFN